MLNHEILSHKEYIPDVNCNALAFITVLMVNMFHEN